MSIVENMVKVNQHVGACVVFSYPISYAIHLLIETHFVIPNDEMTTKHSNIFLLVALLTGFILTFIGV